MQTTNTTPAAGVGEDLQHVVHFVMADQLEGRVVGIVPAIVRLPGLKRGKMSVMAGFSAQEWRA